MEPSKEYIKGFNNGYFLAKYNPTLLDKLVLTENQNTYTKALNDGKSLYVQEKRLIQIKNIDKIPKDREIKR